MPSGLREEVLMRSMIRVLREHPVEWLTFKRLSVLIALPDCNADFWAAILIAG
jgi:hypothetical protein